MSTRTRAILTRLTLAAAPVAAFVLAAAAATGRLHYHS